MVLQTRDLLAQPVRLLYEHESFLDFLQMNRCERVLGRGHQVRLGKQETQQGLRLDVAVLGVTGGGHEQRVA